MGFLLHIPVVVSFMLLAAHFLRGDQSFVAIVVLLCPCLLFTNRAWAVRIVQLILIVGSIEWLRTLLAIQAFRADHGLPWLRLAFILGSVALFTFCSALVFFNSSLKRKYGLGKDSKSLDT